MKYAVHIRGMLRDVPVINSQTLQIVPVKGAPALKNGEYNLHGDKMPAQKKRRPGQSRSTLQRQPGRRGASYRDFVTMPDQQPWVTGKDGTVYFLFAIKVSTLLVRPMMAQLTNQIVSTKLNTLPPCRLY